MKRLLIAIGVLGTIASSASAEIVKGSREYTRLKKQIQTEQKQLLHDKQQVAEFSSLLREMESADPKETKRYYWKLNAQIQSAMDREFNETVNHATASRPKVLTAGASQGLAALEDSSAPGPGSLSRQRANRMKLIVAESQGLEHALANGDRDARARYHHLLAEFLGMMRAEAEDTADHIAAQKEKLK